MNRRALVLGGGGSAGNAWEIGIVAGLADSGVDLNRADLIIGTSAGATVAAQITAAAPTDLYRQTVSAPIPQRPARRPGPPPIDYMKLTADIIAASSDPADMRRRLGAKALEMEDESPNAAAQQQRRDVVAARLPSQDWPDQPILITAVDARTGEPIVFDRDSGVALVDAVSASTASVGAGLPHPVGDRRFIDGGYRANENADLATGYARVLVLSPFGGRSRTPPEWRTYLAAHVEDLRATGSHVETVFPDEAALAAFGTDMMSPASRPPAARAGYDHGRALADRLADFWRR